MIGHADTTLPQGKRHAIQIPEGRVEKIDIYCLAFDMQTVLGNAN